MKITVLTLFKEQFDSFLNTSIIKRIIEKGLVEVKVVDIRDYSLDVHRHVDDTPYGGGAGMLMKVDVLDRAIKDNRSPNSYVLLTSPKAKPFIQEDAYRLSKMDDIVIICGHYEGVDARIDKYIDENISIGDYVLTGGEIPACIMVDAISRLVPGVLSDKECYEKESIASGLLEYPQYTRPRVWNGKEVPEVLLSGHHENIDKWRLEKSLEITKERRPDLYEKYIKENK